MSQKEQYQPEWISAEETSKWLGVDVSTLFRWRLEKGFAFTKIGKNVVMYDRKQINSILNDNSTYKFQGLKLTA